MKHEVLGRYEYTTEMLAPLTDAALSAENARIAKLPFLAKELPYRTVEALARDRWELVAGRVRGNSPPGIWIEGALFRRLKV